MFFDGWKSLLFDNVVQCKSGYMSDKNKVSYWNGGVKWVFFVDLWCLD